jgi:hypothetical protein
MVAQPRRAHTELCQPPADEAGGDGVTSALRETPGTREGLAAGADPIGVDPIGAARGGRGHRIQRIFHRSAVEAYQSRWSRRARADLTSRTHD